ncbi:DUF3139 domain-containing protein [Sporosarcina obsidiansis]|uniref:DUF3139 domain-containing protein n=1 Tax=Sporosarcina obsidiansis TaxID=2660748 RepID=UPI00129B9689|nr:DUF3139 domain-containing protein [Sporosarcina obsidiansis]
MLKGDIMKKLILITLSIPLVILLLYTTNKFIHKKSAERNFDSYVETHGYQDDIFSQETMYDSKIGVFYIRVYYKKYPEREYEYYYFSNDYIVASAYEKGVQINTDEYLEGFGEENEKDNR